MQLPFDEKPFQDAIGRTLELARREGASDAEVAISASTGLNVNVRLGEVDTLEFLRDKSMGITVYKGLRKAQVSTNDLSPQAIEETVVAACRMASLTEADPHAGLADRVLMATEFPDLDLYHPYTIETPDAIQMAKSCEAAALDYDPRIKNSEGGHFNASSYINLYGNSLDFLGQQKASTYSLSCSPIAETAHGMQRDYDYSVSRTFADLWAPEVIGRQAAMRAVQRLDGRKLKTAQMPVIFEARIATSLFNCLFGAISGRALYQKSSFLLDKIGHSIFPDFVEIKECPRRKRAHSSANFDAEGVATQDKYIIQSGRLETYLLGSYSARRLGMSSTGNAGGVLNIEIKASGADELSSLMRTMDTGLLVTEIMGQGVNLVTGDYSKGASGYYIEKGVIQYPVEEITIAANLNDMYKNIVALGSDLEQRSKICVGSVLLEQMTVAGS